MITDFYYHHEALSKAKTFPNTLFVHKAG